MWGAIIGDLAGSIYEFDQTKQIKSISINNVIEANSFFSDDTILTIAILDAFLNNKDYERYLKKYTLEYLDYHPLHKPYFQKPFSPGFIKWANGQREGKSTGNGAMMRISPVAYLSNSEEELIKNTIKATECSHNSKEAITNTQIIAKIIYLAKKGFSKEKIFELLNLHPTYIPFKEFNMTCNATINNCLYAIEASNSFEEAIRLIITCGGDTDTNACIVGSIAEALYGIENCLIEQAKEKIPPEFTDKLEKGYSLIKKDYHF